MAGVRGRPPGRWNPKGRASSPVIIKSAVIIERPLAFAGIGRDRPPAGAVHCRDILMSPIVPPSSGGGLVAVVSGLAGYLATPSREPQG